MADPYGRRIHKVKSLTAQLQRDDDVSSEVLIDYASRKEDGAEGKKQRNSFRNKKSITIEPEKSDSCEDSFHQCEPEILPVEDLQSTASAYLWQPQWWKGSQVIDFIVNFLQSFVMTEANPKRKAWHIILFILLVYTGTLFPYRLCFLEFYIPDGIEIDRNWKNFEIVVDVLFWFDLVVNFFFSYTNAYGAEITSIGAICRHYLCGYFALNLIACLPEDAVRPLFGVITESSAEGHADGSSSTMHKITRISRLQRTTRLARLARLVRLARIAKLVAFVMNSIFWKWLMDMRGMRVVNFVVFLFWIVHILACGWYLCAALHDDYNETWVNRRPVDVDGTSLLTRGPAEQWLHSCYFVFTVFTTVGFGDMSAMTTGEIVYVCFTMLVGAVVHSIIVSEMINILTFIDTTQLEILKHREVIEGFSKHTLLDGEMRVRLTHWVEDLAQKGMLTHQYDREVMRDILTGGHLPHYLLKTLPRGVFQGKLLNSRFIKACYSYSRDVPPRLSLLVALALVPRQYVKFEVVYQFHDHPYHIFIVLDGIFADVGIPDPHGGRDESPFVGAHSVVNAFSGGAVSRKSSAGVNAGSASRMLKSATLPLGATLPSTPTRMFSGTMRKEKTDHSDHDALSDSTPTTPSMNQGPKLFPYKLHCPGSYFGDIEFFEGGSRRCTVRCEGRAKTYTNPDGSFTERSVRHGPSCALLLLHKQEFTRILEEFPHYRKCWQQKAKRREFTREERRDLLTCGRDVYPFAAKILQSFCTRLQEKGTKSTHQQAKVKLAPAARSSKPRANASSVQTVREGLHGELRAGLQEMRLELRSGIAQIREDLAIGDHLSRYRDPVAGAGGLPAQDGATDTAEPSMEVLALRAEVARLRRELAEVTHSGGSNLRHVAADSDSIAAPDGLPIALAGVRSLNRPEPSEEEC